MISIQVSFVVSLRVALVGCWVVVTKRLRERERGRETWWGAGRARGQGSRVVSGYLMSGNLHQGQRQVDLPEYLYGDKTDFPINFGLGLLRIGSLWPLAE
jgi:hypothetical protein